MAHIENSPPGSFCWIELASPDQNASKNFYQPLFGWDSAEYPMGPDGNYTIYRLEGRDVGGGFTITKQMKDEGVPPHWMLYIAAASADDAASKAAANGAKVIVQPFDVSDMGRMAVVMDPTHAMFSVWQAKASKGMGIVGVPGAFCWADLSTPDPKAASDFYSKTFGWKIAPGEHDPSGYLHISNGEQMIGGIPPAAFRNPNAPPHWLLYFQVDNCDASTAKAKEHGANVYVEPMTMEGVGRWSVVADPHGAVFSLFQPLPRGTGD